MERAARRRQRSASVLNPHQTHKRVITQTTFMLPFRLSCTLIFSVTLFVGRGGVAVCSVHCNWTVAGSNPPQATKAYIVTLDKLLNAHP